MASSKKKKSKAKPENAETRKKAKPSPKKNNKKMTIQNGTVSDSKVVGTPASSSINDSQPDSETEQDSRSQEQEATNEKKKKPNKNRKKIGRQDDDDEDSKLCNFPMDRIKRIFKTQSSDFGVTREAVFLVNKATDKFLEQFCEDAYECCANDRKKSLAYKHLAIVSEQSKYEFLTDYVPEKIKAEDALAQRELAEGGEG